MTNNVEDGRWSNAKRVASAIQEALDQGMIVRNQYGQRVLSTTVHKDYISHAREGAWGGAIQTLFSRKPWGLNCNLSIAEFNALFEGWTMLDPAHVLPLFSKVTK